jgi:hypothetical protein
MLIIIDPSARLDDIVGDADDRDVCHCETKTETNKEKVLLLFITSFILYIFLLIFF